MDPQAVIRRMLEAERPATNAEILQLLTSVEQLVESYYTNGNGFIGQARALQNAFSKLSNAMIGKMKGGSPVTKAYQDFVEALGSDLNAFLDVRRKLEDALGAQSDVEKAAATLKREIKGLEK